MCKRKPNLFVTKQLHTEYSHEPVVTGGSRLLPSHRAGKGDLARQQPRPTKFMVTGHGRQAKGTSRVRVGSLASRLDPHPGLR